MPTITKAHKMHHYVVEQTFSPFNHLPKQMVSGCIAWGMARGNCAGTQTVSNTGPPPGTRVVILNDAIEYMVIDDAWRCTRYTLTVPKEALHGVVDIVRACAQRQQLFDVFTHINGVPWVARDMFISDETTDTFEVRPKWWAFGHA